MGLFLLFLAARSLHATDLFDPVPIRVLRGPAATPWDMIECLRDRDPHLRREMFLRSTQPRDHTGGGIVDGFGTTTPPSSDFLLHYAPRSGRTTQRIPVLLIPGSGSNANHSFVGVMPQGEGGMMRYLSDRGLPVFAVTFAANHGDNHFQAEAIANAITKIRQVTGAPRVDLVAHSKGAVAARIYLSDLVASRPWRTRYRRDVRRALFLAAPNRGTDFVFRHPVSAALVFAREGLAFPAPRDLTYGFDLTGRTGILGGAFSGESQMLHDWSDRYPPNPMEPDSIISFSGGYGVAGHYPGIRKAIQRGGDLIERLERKGLDPSVEVGILYGTRPWFDRVTPDGIRRDAIMGEMDGPSDGIVLVDSLRATGGLVRRGARLLAVKELPINHAQCVYHPDALAWVYGQLIRPEDDPPSGTAMMPGVIPSSMKMTKP